MSLRFDPTAPAFTSAYAFTLSWEMGTVENIHDHGGRTKDGITQATYTAWRLHRGLGDHDVFQMPDAEREAIYLSRWADFRCSEVAASSIAAAIWLFDATTNHRPKTAVRMFQKAAGMPPEWDGLMGKLTLSKFRIQLKEIGEAAFVAHLLERRAMCYKTILQADPTQRVFAKGWGRRLNSLCDYLGSPHTWESV